jgi:hypothetical protein
MRTDFAKLARQRKAALAAHGGDPVAASLTHHRARLSRAVAARDYSGMRDAEKVIRDLEAILRPSVWRATLARFAGGA